MKVVAFNGSPRRNGNTERLFGYVFEELARENITTELVPVGGLRLRGCTACGICKERQDLTCAYGDDGLDACVAQMVAADAVLLGSPTYFADVTSEMKALIDRAGYVCRANGNPLRRKPGAAIVAVRRAGAMHAFDTLNHFFTISEMLIVGSSYWNIGIGRAAGDVDGDEEGVATMRTLGQNLAWLLARLGS